MRNNRSAGADGTTPSCAVAVWSGFHAAVEQLDPFRQPATVAGNPVSSTFLRHADEQTIAAVAAVNQAVPQLGDPDFRSWGVLGCLQRPGRAVAAWNFERYKTEGAWGVSPHIIPHRCLHSLSGAISLALKCTGPNFGVGEPEAVFPLALAWLAQGRVPGLWVVLTSLDPELPPHAEVPTPTPGTVVHALALALQPAPPEDTETRRQGDKETDRVSSPCLRVSVSPCLTPPAPARRWDLLRLEAWLAGRVPGDWHLPGGLTVQRTGKLPRTAPSSRLLLGSLQEVRS